MTLKSLGQYGLIIAVICTSAFAEGHIKSHDHHNKKAAKPDEIQEVVLKRPFTIKSEKEVVTAIQQDQGPVEKQEKEFAFDWDLQATIAENKKKIGDEETFLTKINDVSKLSKEDQQALGLLCYKLGTFYTHVSREPDLAITKLMMANALLTGQEDKAWNYNHLAYAYAERYATSDNSADKEIALYYTNKVISELLHKKHDKSIAFAYSTKGLIQNQDKDYIQAEKNIKKALAIYESLPNSKDDQYERTKNRLANALLGQRGHEKEAIAIIRQVKRYWISKGNLSQNPYAARCLITLGQAYLKTGLTEAACGEFKTAISIYENFYGNKSALLVKPYQMLAQAYKNLGKHDQASAYEKKADAINRA